MRRRNCCLAAIMAAVLVLQTPMMASAGYIEVSTEGTGEITVNADEESNYNVEDGVVEAKGNFDASEVGQDAVNVSGQVTLIINDGGAAATGDYGSGVWVTDGGTVTINNGDVSSEKQCGIYVEDGTVTVNNGDVISDAEVIEYTNEEGNLQYYVPSTISLNDGGTITVIGGNVSSKNGTAIGGFGEGTVTIDGNVSSESTYNPDLNDAPSTVFAGNGSQITITGNVTAKDGNAVETGDGGTITVTGDVSSENSCGAMAYGGEITINGTVTSGGNDPGEAAVRAENGATVIVGEAIATGDGHGVAVNNANVTVNGDVSSDSNAAINIEYDGRSTVVITGNVTTGSEYDGASVITNDSSDLIIYGNVSSSLQIDLNDSEEKGSVVVLGNISSYYESPSLWINTDNLGEGTKNVSDMLSLLPNIVVGSLSNGVGVFVDPLKIEDEIQKEIDETETNAWDYVADLVQKTISYFIKTDDGVTLTSGTYDITAADNKTYSVANADDVITLSVASDYSLVESSLSNLEWYKNTNGTYTIIVPKNGGVYIVTNKIISVIEDGDNISITVSSEESTPSVVVDRSYAILQKKLQNDIKAIPTDGTYEIVSDSLISFNRKTIEAFAARPDVTISVTYKFQGKKYKTVIPAGYQVLELLNEDGYCGCLYLNLLFGSELVD